MSQVKQLVVAWTLVHGEVRANSTGVDNEKMHQINHDARPLITFGALHLCLGLCVWVPVLRRSRRIPPVTTGVSAAHDHALFVPAELLLAAHLGAAIAQSQSTPALGRGVLVRAVQQQVGVQRDLAGLQFVIDHFAKHFWVIDRLIQHTLLGVFAQAIGQVSDEMRPGDKAHAAVAAVAVEDLHGLAGD